jgi:tRNA (guanine26-N2/guanine27-N2)-dimethyltransferase
VCFSIVKKKRTEISTQMALVSTVCKEGGAALVVPTLEEPKMLPAFFNPRGKFVRDVSIVCYRTYSSQFLQGSDREQQSFSFADALTGTGARGVRVAKEVPSIGRVFLNDINSKALDYAKQSVVLNDLSDKCVLSRSEVSSFLSTRAPNGGERFDFVDLDPFGTPSDFVDCALRAVKNEGMLSLTATDSAVLCGVYPRVALRKYLGLSLRTDYCHEMAMRLLFGLVAQTAMRLEVGIAPLFCHHDMHYFRIYLSVKVGNRFSKENEPKLGYILHCFNCGEHTILSRDEFFSLRNDREKKTGRDGEPRKLSEYLICQQCGNGSREKGGRVALGGPLWIGNIQDRAFAKKCSEDPAAKGKTRLLFAEELDLPLYYDLATFPLKKGASLPKITKVMESLHSLGFQSSRTRLNPHALRTDASLQTLRELVAELAR